MADSAARGCGGPGVVRGDGPFLERIALCRDKKQCEIAPGSLVYLAPVKNETGEKAFDKITELIRAGLSQSAQINLLEQGRVGDTLQRMTKAPDTTIDASIGREIAMRTGATRVVFAKVSGSSGVYRLYVNVEQPDNTPARARHTWTNSFVWESPQNNGNGEAIPQPLLAAVRDASDWVRGKRASPGLILRN